MEADLDPASRPLSASLADGSTKTRMAGGAVAGCGEEGVLGKMRPNAQSKFLATLGRLAGALLIVVSTASLASAGIPQQVGSSTGLPLPRYVSLKTSRVNLREGPSKDHVTDWIFERTGLPVEVMAESDAWRKIRASDGTVGWVLQSLLSGRRTVLVAPWRKKEMLTLYSKPSPTAAIAANLQAGVLGTVKSCDGDWCRIYGNGFDGYMLQTSLWGVYPSEKVEP